MGTLTLPPPAIGPLLGRVLGDLRESLGSLTVFAALFSLAYGLLYVPFSDWMVHALVSLSGHPAITNFDIVQLWCCLALLCSLVLIVLGQFLSHAGVMVLAVMNRAGEKLTVRRIVRAAFGAVVRMFRLGFLLVAVNVLVFLPIVGLGGLTYLLLLTAHDINSYVADRPPAFWIAVSIGGVLALAALAAAAFLYVRWVFALPIMLFETRAPIASLIESRNRVRGAAWRIAFILLAWHVLATLLTVGVLLLFNYASEGTLSLLSNPTLVRVVITVLVVLHGLLAAVLAFLHFSVHSLLILNLYEQRSEQGRLALPDFLQVQTALAETERARAKRLTWGRASVVCAGVVGLLWFVLPPGPVLTDVPRSQMIVSGHRGYGKDDTRPLEQRVPENTIPAFKKAIECGADYGEMDVQETLDGQIVVNHDNDLKRVAGVSEAVWDLPLEKIKQLNVGRPGRVAPQYEGTRIPTLAEVIAAVRDDANYPNGRDKKLKLNIEIKFNPGRKKLKDYSFAVKVADLVGELKFEDQCIVTSLDDQGVLVAKKHFDSQFAPRKLRVGAIIGNIPTIGVPLVMGQTSKLPVDALIVPSDRLTGAFLQEAREHGKEVHVWGADTRKQMALLLDRGVYNLIVDHPEVLEKLIQERAGMSKSERLREAWQGWLSN
jgi:glycerophosphoryl diester phosphodiesterase